MARIDSILNLVDRQGANELRLGTDKEPQMFADGSQKRLVIPKTTTETLRELLGELLTDARESELVGAGRVEFLYEAVNLGPFRVTLVHRRGKAASLEFDAVFLRGKGKAAPAGIAPPAAAPAGPVAAEQPAAVVAAPRGDGAAGAQITLSAELVGIVRRAVAMRASDVHVANGEVPTVRVDGKLRSLDGEGPMDLERILRPGLGDVARERLAAGASADLALGVDGIGRLRLNVYTSSAGLVAAIRLLPSAPARLAELGLPLPLDDLVDLPHGLVLVTGPTGSGKSTTLAALAQEALFHRSILLLSLEDPIEYTLSAGPAVAGHRGLVRQRQVGRDVRDFATGLRDALREDPDVLVIGEMRDAETISLALTAAETGHLVLASLHSRGAAAAVERIVDTYPGERQHQIRVQLADALRAVVAQRLLPRASGEGRAVALEVLRVHHAVANAIREGKTASITSSIQAGKREGMIALERCLADLVQKRTVSLEDARSVANDPGALASYLSA